MFSKIISELINNRIHVHVRGSDEIYLLSLSLSLAMTKPDRPLIAQVMLYSQGFRTAEVLASKIVPFFK